MRKSTKRFAFTTMAAVAAGYVAGILTAPKSGKETRADIKNTAEKSYAEAEKELKKLHTELSQALEVAKTKLETANGKSREELEAAMKIAKQGKDKAREILSAVHEGEAEDKDLKKAITEATKAFNHLKTFLGKRS
jgi:gas vesicle protein